VSAYFRKPRTQGERRSADSLTRAKRNAGNVPTSWDDLDVSARRDRSWKRYRRRQYRDA
jgi:hypothetical protein